MEKHEKDGEISRARTEADRALQGKDATDRAYAALKEEFSKNMAMTAARQLSLRGVADNLPVVLKEMQLALVQLPDAPQGRDFASMTTFFLSAAKALDSYQKGHT